MATRNNDNEHPNWDGKERRSYVVLSPGQVEEMLEESARRGADRAFNEIYSLIGTRVVKKTALLIGAVILAVLAWLTNAVNISIPAIEQTTHEGRK